MVYDSMSFGLTPTNSRYFVFGVFALSKNLDPVLLGIGLASDRAVDTYRNEIY
jgi:hypothetical protein